MPGDDELVEWKLRVPEIVCAVGCRQVVTMCPLIYGESPLLTKISRIFL